MHMAFLSRVFKNLQWYGMTKCVDKKDAQQKCRTKVRHFCVFTKNTG